MLELADLAEGLSDDCDFAVSLRSMMDFPEEGSLIEGLLASGSHPTSGNAMMRGVKLQNLLRHGAGRWTAARRGGVMGSLCGD